MSTLESALTSHSLSRTIVLMTVLLEIDVFQLLILEESQYLILSILEFVINNRPWTADISSRGYSENAGILELIIMIINLF